MKRANMCGGLLSVMIWPYVVICAVFIVCVLRYSMDDEYPPYVKNDRIPPVRGCGHRFELGGPSDILSHDNYGFIDVNDPCAREGGRHARRMADGGRG